MTFEETLVEEFNKSTSNWKVKLYPSGDRILYKSSKGVVLDLQRFLFSHIKINYPILYNKMITSFPDEFI